MQSFIRTTASSPGSKVNTLNTLTGPDHSGARIVSCDGNTVAPPRIPLAIGDPRRRDGAFVEPSGRNGWQRWQMEHPRKPLKQAERQRVATDGNGFAALVREGSTSGHRKER